MECGHWVYDDGEFLIDDWFGFVYEITNLENGRKYIGKKQFSSKRRHKVAGRKNRKVVIKESDWGSYTSSSVSLNEDIERWGKEKFQFRILKLCNSKRDLGYSETKEQFSRDVLNARLENGERAYYNENIMSRWFSHNKPHTAKVREQIGGSLRDLWKTPEFREKTSHTAWNKDKPWPKKVRERISKSLEGNIPWNKDKKTGQIPWNKDLPIANRKSGWRHTEEALQKMRKARTEYWESKRKVSHAPYINSGSS